MTPARLASDIASAHDNGDLDVMGAIGSKHSHEVRVTAAELNQPLAVFNGYTR